MSAKMVAAGLMLGGVLGCASLSRWVNGPDEPPPREIPKPCADSMTHVQASRGEPGFGSPTPLKIYMPPMPTPAGIKGLITATFHVDSIGRIDGTSLVITGITNNGQYLREFRVSILRMEFRPALSNATGCAVSAKAAITYDVGRGRP